MDFSIGDIVRDTERGVGVVQLIDGVAVWVRWGIERHNHTPV